MKLKGPWDKCLLPDKKTDGPQEVEGPPPLQTGPETSVNSLKTSGAGESPHCIVDSWPFDNQSNQQCPLPTVSEAALSRTLETSREGSHVNLSDICSSLYEAADSSMLFSLGLSTARLSTVPPPTNTYST